MREIYSQKPGLLRQSQIQSLSFYRHYTNPYDKGKKKRLVKGRIYQIVNATVSSTVGDTFLFNFVRYIRIHKIYTQASYTFGLYFNDDIISPVRQYTGVNPGTNVDFPYENIVVTASVLATTQLSLNSSAFANFPPGNTDFKQPIITKSFTVRHFTVGIKAFTFYFDFIDE